MQGLGVREGCNLSQERHAEKGREAVTLPRAIVMRKRSGKVMKQF